MADRLYTVKEIMLMRLAIRDIGVYSPIPMSGEVIEAQLRTYMANGTAPDELLDAAADEVLAAEERARPVPAEAPAEEKPAA